MWKFSGRQISAPCVCPAQYRLAAKRRCHNGCHRGQHHGIPTTQNGKRRGPAWTVCLYWPLFSLNSTRTWFAFAGISEYCVKVYKDYAVNVGKRPDKGSAVKTPLRMPQVPWLIYLQSHLFFSLRFSSSCQYANGALTAFCVLAGDGSSDRAKVNNHYNADNHGLVSLEKKLSWWLSNTT